MDSPCWRSSMTRAAGPVFGGRRAGLAGMRTGKPGPSRHHLCRSPPTPHAPRSARRGPAPPIPQRAGQRRSHRHLLRRLRPQRSPRRVGRSACGPGRPLGPYHESLLQLTRSPLQVTAGIAQLTRACRWSKLVFTNAKIARICPWRPSATAVHELGLDGRRPLVGDHGWPLE